MSKNKPSTSNAVDKNFIFLNYNIELVDNDLLYLVLILLTSDIENYHFAFVFLI